jgi:hypothetical protein
MVHWSRAGVVEEVVNDRGETVVVRASVPVGDGTRVIFVRLAVEKEQDE